MKKYLLYILISVTAYSCSTNTSKTTTESTVDTAVAEEPLSNYAAADTFVRGEIISNINCASDPSKHFALYIPKEPGPLPGIIFFFDAHGDPVIPLTKYKALADEFKFVLAGSYDSKNGNDWTTTSQIWQALIAEKRITYDLNRIYTAGFSGGAKVASYIALNNSNISGVIANGAGLPETQQQLPAGNFTFVGIAGTGDMNMTELVSLDEQLNQTSIRHQLLFFDGKHEWCPVETMHDAFVWLHFDEVRKSKMEIDPKWRDDFITKHSKLAEQFKKQNNLYTAVNEFKLLNNYLRDGISPAAAKYENEAAALVKLPEYQKQQAAFNSLLETEKNIKSNLIAMLQQNTDLGFWKTTIEGLNKQSRQNDATAAMYQRATSYLSLACYSLSNRALNTGENEIALNYISIYKMVDPGNSEAWYFSAMLNARTGKMEAAKTDLKKAIEKGFNDWKRMEMQQEFAALNKDDLKSK